MKIRITVLINMMLIIGTFFYFQLLAFGQTINLKSGVKVEGRIIEKTDNYTKIDFYGVTLTYDKDEIASIEGSSFSQDNRLGYLDYYNRAIEYGSKGEFNNAEIELKKAQDLDQFGYQAQYMLILLKDVNNGKIKAEYASRIFQSLYYWTNRKPDQAISELKKAIEINPDYALGYRELGALYFSLKQTDEAIKNYQKAIEINPKYARAYNELGYLYGTLNEDEKSLTYYSKAIELDPKEALVYHRIGFTYYALGRYSQARENLLKAIQLYKERKDSRFISAIEEYLNKIPAD
jgi:tetratricopeptide (TPR) repeat protein